MEEDVDVGWSIIGNNHNFSDTIQSKLKECTQTMQELRRMQMLELNLGLGLEVMVEGPLASMLKEYSISATESNAIVLYNSLQNLSLPSQAIIGDFDNIASQQILLTQLCSEFDNSAEHITAIDVMIAQVKLSEFSDLANDPKKIPDEVENPTVEEAKLIKHENVDLSIDISLEVEKMNTYK